MNRCYCSNHHLLLHIDIYNGWCYHLWEIVMIQTVRKLYLTEFYFYSDWTGPRTFPPILVSLEMEIKRGLEGAASECDCQNCCVQKLERRKYREQLTWIIVGSSKALELLKWSLMENLYYSQRCSFLFNSFRVSWDTARTKYPISHLERDISRRDAVNGISCASFYH